MKTLAHLILLLSSLSLVSCGAKKTGMTLKISNGMALSNNSYNGGLVFFGRSTDGKMFSAPVAIKTGSGNQVQVELDRGVWTFGAIGWGGAVFDGIAKCAITTATLNATDQTINLDLDSSNCSQSEFGGNLTANSGYFKPLRFVTCGTLYDDTSLPTPTLLATIPIAI